MNEPSPLTTTAILAATTDILLKNGYQRVAKGLTDWESESARLFEDFFGIVGAVVFDTVSDLIERWAELQGSLAEIIAAHVGHQESKAWEGYLLLMTPSSVGGSAADIEEIRYNTNRLRKIVATGRDLREVSDVRRVLSGLLPFPETVGHRNLPHAASALDVLPSILVTKGIRRGIAESLVRAYRKHEAMIEALHGDTE